MKKFNEWVCETKKEKEVDFEKAVDYANRYPELRNFFTYAGNIQELDVLKDDLYDENIDDKKYDKEVIEFFYNERKKNLLYGTQVNKSDDKNDPDGKDMEGRAKCRIYANLEPTYKPNAV